MKAFLRLAVVGSALVGCAPSRLVAPLRYEETTAPKVEERFRARAPPLAPVTDVSEPTRETTLPNGVHIVLVERHDFPVVAARLVIDRGALDFDDAGGVELSEAAYFFGRGGDEGTHEKRSAQAARFGIGWQTGLAADFAWSAVRSPASSFDAALELLAGTISDQLSKEEYDRRAAEWAHTAAAFPTSIGVIERRVLFDPKHAYGYAGPGVKPIALQAAVSLHERLFQPTHATVVIVGDVTPAEVDASVLRLFGAWKETVTVPRNTSPAPPRNGPRLAVLNHRGWAQRHGAVFARGPLPTSDDMEAFELLAKVLGGGISSTLFDHLRESGAAYAIGGAVEVRREATWISLVGSYDALRAVTGVSDVLAAVDGARRGSPSDQEISLARETLLADWRASMATVEGSADRYATAIGLGVGVDRAREYPARVLRLGKEDLVRVARAYMAPEVLHVAFLGDDRWLNAEQLGMGGVTTLSARP